MLLTALHHTTTTFRCVRRRPTPCSARSYPGKSPHLRPYYLPTPAPASGHASATRNPGTAADHRGRTRQGHVGAGGGRRDRDEPGAALRQRAALGAWAAQGVRGARADEGRGADQVQGPEQEAHGRAAGDVGAAEQRGQGRRAAAEGEGAHEAARGPPRAGGPGADKDRRCGRRALRRVRNAAGGFTPESFLSPSPALR